MPKRWEANRVEAEQRAAAYRERWINRWGYLTWEEAYEQHLASPEWQALRRETLARSKEMCERCGNRLASQVHHVTYERLGDEELSDLLAVCRSCHEAIHGIR